VVDGDEESLADKQSWAV